MNQMIQSEDSVLSWTSDESSKKSLPLNRWSFQAMANVRFASESRTKWKIHHSWFQYCREKNGSISCLELWWKFGGICFAHILIFFSCYLPLQPKSQKFGDSVRMVVRNSVFFPFCLSFSLSPYHFSKGIFLSSCLLSPCANNLHFIIANNALCLMFFFSFFSETFITRRMTFKSKHFEWI